jgi:hypothetical protein
MKNTNQPENVWVLFVKSSFDMPSIRGIYTTLHKALEAQEKHKVEYPEDIENTIVKMMNLDKQPCYTPISFK